MKIYCIYSGGLYDQHSLVGYTTSKEDALKLCIFHNDSDDCQSAWYYRELEKMECPSNINILFIHTLSFDSNEKLTNHFVSASKNDCFKSKVEFENNEFTVRVCLNTIDEETARNIAQNMLKKFIDENHM